MSGSGTFIYSNGDVYEGEFEDGNLNGYGIKIFKNGGRQEGIWQNNIIHSKS